METQKGSHARQAALFVPVLAGVVASAILLVDYSRVAPVFCDVTEGCARLKHTVYASFLHVPTPAWGLAGFLAIGGLGLLRGARARQAIAALATVAALVACVLLSVQLRADVWCKYCCVADASALILCGVAWWKLLAAWDGPTGVASRAVLGSALVASFAVPCAVGVLKKPEVPDVIAKELAATPNGQITVVDFVDFECPFCRQTHAVLEPILASHAGAIHLVRRQVPLERLHPHAFAAARAACCGEQLGKGDAMANALFESPVDDLTPEGCAKLATSLGLDENAFRACVENPATDAKIHAEQAEFKESKGHGLPTLWIGEEKIEGAVPEETLDGAITRAIERRG